MRASVRKRGGNRPDPDVVPGSACRLVFDSEYDFLYRQKGRLKLGDAIPEEFLPRLAGRA